MEFIEIAQMFEKLEKSNKRLDKILILRDFIESKDNFESKEKKELKEKKKYGKIFDVISGNFFRLLDKKKIGISLKSIISTISLISKKTESEINREFNKIGDIGEVAVNSLKNNKQKSLNMQKLHFEDIIQTFKTLTTISGNNSNKRKKELLSSLFLKANSDVEIKFLARLLIDDLKIGASDGVLRETLVNILFPNIIGINNICSKCSYVNLNQNKCYNCNEIKDKNQEFLVNKNNFSTVEIKQNDTGLKKFNVNYEINPVEFALRRSKEKYFIKTDNERELYNSFIKTIETKYNLINSYEIFERELEDDINNLFNFEIKLNTPIKSMLGTRSKNSAEAFEMVSTPAIVDYKYDGLRCQIHNNYGDVRLFSRNLEEITNQFPEIIKYIKDNFSDVSFVIDSECVGYNYKTGEFLDFQILSRRIITKDVSNVSDIHVSIKAFDLMYLNDETILSQKYETRRDKLEKLFLNRELKQDLIFDTKNLK